MQDLLSRLSPQARLLLSLLLFFNVTVFGCLCLLLSEKMAL